MFSDLQNQLHSYITEALSECFPAETAVPSFDTEIPADDKHGDLSCNIALKSSKIFRKPPLALANEWLPHLRSSLKGSPIASLVLKVEVKSPGFINFFFTPGAYHGMLDELLQKGEHYACADAKKDGKIQIEFVSANPTGPLSVAHARQAAVGDALGNILRYSGYDVTKEFYVNDEGNQINILGNSIRLRALELLGSAIEFPDDGYQGDYIKDIAQSFLEKNRIKTADQLKSIEPLTFNQFGVDVLLGTIKNELQDFGVVFDVWSHQSVIATQSEIEKLVGLLTKMGHTKKEDGAVWFCSTKFGDDKDRVIQKSDGSYTYLTPDIVYHKNKFERGFTQVVNMWGPDHHGYIARIQAAAQALGRSKDAIRVLIVQLATIYKNGQVLSMSTRRGQYISMREVMEEVGVDAARFFFLNRHISAHLDFDLDLAKKQTPENPIFYIQYAHARVHSINKKAKDEGVPMIEHGFRLLKEPDEIILVKKLSMFQGALNLCLEQFDPYALTEYLHELAILFHRFYDKCRVVGEDRDYSGERLALCNATRIVLKIGLTLIGVSAPESM